MENLVSQRAVSREEPKQIQRGLMITSESAKFGDITGTRADSNNQRPNLQTVEHSIQQR